MKFNLKNKLIIGFIGMELFMSIPLAIAIYLTSIEMFVNDFRDHKLSVAKFIASMIKGDIHSKFTNLESIQTHEFKEYYRIINRIYENEKYIRYIYTLYLNKEEEKLYYGVDASRLKNDTIWIESIDVSFSAFMKNDKLTIDFNYELRDSDFKVNIPNYGELKIRIQQSPAKAIFIGKEKILEVKNEKPFEVITKSGILNNENRVKEFSIPFFNSKEDFQLSFSQKGQPGSDPGSDFIDRPKQIEKIKNLIKFNSDFIDEEPTYKSYGSLLSAYSIIKDKDGSGVGVVIVDVESKEIDNFKHRFFTVVIVLSIIIFILTTILSLILAKYFTKPLEQLTTAVEKLSEGNFESKVEIKSKDEFGKLANSFNSMVISLKNSHDSQYQLIMQIKALNDNLENKVKENTKEIIQQSKELEKQIQIANKIQMSLLPLDIPDLKFAHISFKYQPMMGVGGDFLDIFYRSKNDLTLFICDVSGHGVPAAFLATMVKMSLKECYDLNLGSADSLKKIKQLLKGKMSGHFITATIAKINIEQNRMIVASAGHLPLIHLKPNGDSKYISSRGKVINDFFPLEPEEVSMDLEEGDKLILYTDGITEARNSYNEMFGDDRLLDLASKNFQLNSDELCKSIYDEIINYTGNRGMEPFEDDITLLIAEYKGVNNAQ